MASAAKTGGRQSSTREPGGRQDDALNVGALKRSLEVFCFGNTVVWHHNLFTFDFCVLTFAF